jgi:hypothetical protein
VISGEITVSKDIPFSSRPRQFLQSLLKSQGSPENSGEEHKMAKEKSAEKKKKRLKYIAQHVTYLVGLARQYWNRWAKGARKKPASG